MLRTRTSTLMPNAHSQSESPGDHLCIFPHGYLTTPVRGGTDLSWHLDCTCLDCHGFLPSHLLSLPFPGLCVITDQHGTKGIDGKWLTEEYQVTLDTPTPSQVSQPKVKPAPGGQLQSPSTGKLLCNQRPTHARS